MVGVGACVTGFATNRRQTVSHMQPQSAENHRYKRCCKVRLSLPRTYIHTYVCHHGKYSRVVNSVPCKELYIQCTSTNAVSCWTKVEECFQERETSNVYLISLPSCLTAPLVASSCQCCPSSHPSHHLLAPGLCQLGQTVRGTPQSQSRERIIKTKEYTYNTKSIHTYVHTCQMCHYKYRMFVDTCTQPHTRSQMHTHAHRVPAHLVIAGLPWPADWVFATSLEWPWCDDCFGRLPAKILQQQGGMICSLVYLCAPSFSSPLLVSDLDCMLL